jgi:lincosamide nucleotidyltransferase A/C/D/E
MSDAIIREEGPATRELQPFRVAGYQVAIATIHPNASRYLRTVTQGEPARAYRGRQPNAPMEATEVVRLLDLFEHEGIEVWIDGGWGVDALLERETREHDDLDLVARLADASRIIALLEGSGYELVAGAPPKSFVLVDPSGRQVDVHPVVFDEARGGGVYVTEDGGEWVYPARGFDGRGRVVGREVRCLSAEVQILVHDGYEFSEKDYLELYLLHERFGVDIPGRYRERALSLGAHGRGPDP